MRILFVCSGNILRSMSAEYLAKHYIKEQNLANLEVSSAGTTAEPQPGFPETFARLRHYGADASRHQQRKVSKELLSTQDLIICMARHHQKTVKELGYTSVLYKELAEHITDDVLDDGEYKKIHGDELFDLPAFIDSLIDYLHETVPRVLEQAILVDHKV